MKAGTAVLEGGGVQEAYALVDGARDLPLAGNEIKVYPDGLDGSGIQMAGMGAIGGKLPGSPSRLSSGPGAASSVSPQAAVEYYLDHRVEAVKHIQDELKIVFEDVYGKSEKKIAVKDEERLIEKYIKQADQLAAEGESPFGILEIARANETLKRDKGQNVDKAAKGGIDFNTDRLDLAVKGDGSAAVRAIDPAMLAQFQSAPGLVPVIIGIETVGDLPGFLGLSKVADQDPAQAVI